MPYNMTKLPNMLKIWPQTNSTFKKLPKDFEDFAKVMKFRQILSHCP